MEAWKGKYNTFPKKFEKKYKHFHKLKLAYS